MSFLGLWVQTEDRQEVPPTSWPLPELRVELTPQLCKHRVWLTEPFGNVLRKDG